MKGAQYLVILAFVLPLTASADDPVAQVTFRVRDDFGNVVTGAPVVVSTFARWVPGEGFGRDEYDQHRGVTDTNGLVVIRLPSKTGKLRYSVFPDTPHFDNSLKMRVSGGVYYRDMGGTIRLANTVDEMWQPWNPTVDIEIKEILNPIPMYARFKESWSFEIPAYNGSLGYDLVKSDWLPPYGQGETADFILKLDCQLGEVTPDEIQYFDAVLTLTFSNEGDGIQEFVVQPLQGSVLRLPRFAPETGYKSEWTQRAFEHQDASHCEHNEKQNYLFRIRTMKNDDGQITNALYGKIAGPIRYEVRVRGASMQMKYYLNPTPNDRNLEFDPSRNLFKDLSPLEQVREP